MNSSRNEVLIGYEYINLHNHIPFMMKPCNIKSKAMWKYYGIAFLLEDIWHIEDGKTSIRIPNAVSLFTSTLYRNKVANMSECD